MANLEGTEKQAAWANDIRTSVLTGIDEKRANMAARVAKIESRPPTHPYALKPGVRDEMFEGMKRLILDLDEARGLLENESSAKWWIDNSRSSLGYVVMAALKRDLSMAI